MFEVNDAEETMHPISSVQSRGPLVSQDFTFISLELSQGRFFPEFY